MTDEVHDNGMMLYVKGHGHIHKVEWMEATSPDNVEKHEEERDRGNGNSNAYEEDFH